MKDMDKTVVEARGQFEALLAYVDKPRPNRRRCMSYVERTLRKSMISCSRKIALIS